MAFGRLSGQVRFSELGYIGQFRVYDALLHVYYL